MGWTSKSILSYPQREGGGGQALHSQMVSTTVKTYHKKFQVNRSRVIKDSKNLWSWLVPSYSLKGLKSQKSLFAHNFFSTGRIGLKFCMGGSFYIYDRLLMSTDPPNPPIPPKAPPQRCQVPKHYKKQRGHNFFSTERKCTKFWEGGRNGKKVG